MEVLKQITEEEFFKLDTTIPKVVLKGVFMLDNGDGVSSINEGVFYFQQIEIEEPKKIILLSS